MRSKPHYERLHHGAEARRARRAGTDDVQSNLALNESLRPSSATFDWRWQRAIALATSATSASRNTEDALIQDATRYLRLRARGTAVQDIAALKYATVAAAQELWMDAGRRSQLMILAIADTAKEEIARHLQVEPTLVAATEGLFFDIRLARQAPLWIRVNVVLRLAREGDVDLAGKVQTAYYGGAPIAKALCAAAIKVPKDEADRLVAQEMLLHAKFTAAVEFPLTSEQSVAFQRLVLDYKLELQKLELRKAIFAQRCQENLRRYELGRQRLALAAARQGVDLSVPSAGPVDMPAANPPMPTKPSGPCPNSRPAAESAGLKSA